MYMYSYYDWIEGTTLHHPSAELVKPTFNLAVSVSLRATVIDRPGLNPAKVARPRDK
jgi:hypothetical protein